MITSGEKLLFNKFKDVCQTKMLQRKLEISSCSINKVIMSPGLSDVKQ